MRSKRIAAALFAAVAVVAFAGSAFAAFWTDEGNYDTSWYSSTDTTFTITTAKQLAGLGYILQYENNRSKFSDEMFAGKTILLGADIDISAHEWKPMGGWVYGNAAMQIYFKGTLDGQGHKITGLNISTLKSNTGTIWNGSGIGFFSEPGEGMNEGDGKGVVQNLCIEGRVVPDPAVVTPGTSAAGAWQYAGILSSSSVNLHSLNVVCSGDVETNATDRGYAGVYVANQYGGEAKNVVTYGTAKAAGSTSMSYAGGMSGYSSNKSSALKHETTTVFTNCVSLLSSVKHAGGVGAGVTMGMVQSTATNCAWLTGTDRPTAAGAVTASDTNKGITKASDVKVTAVMLDSKALATTPPAGSDTVIPLEYYPIGANSDDIKATWTFDDAGVTVKKVEKGFATVSSATTGTKKYTVVVKGLNGFSDSDSVTLKGEITFSDEPIDDPADGEQTTEDDDITLDAISHDSSVAEIEKVDTANDPDDIRKVDAGETAPMDILSSKLDDTNRIAAISNIKPLKTISISIAPADGSTESDLELSIKLGISPTAGKSILALIKPNGSDIYDAFTATCENGVVKFTIKNFRNYFGGSSEAEISAKAAAVEKNIVFVEADVETANGSTSSSGGSCGAGAASLAAFAAIALLKRKKS